MFCIYWIVAKLKKVQLYQDKERFRQNNKINDNINNHYKKYM